MNFFKKSFLAAFGLSALLFGCTPDKVGPTEKNGGKDVAGAFDDTHITLDTVCALTDSIYFRSSDGSFYVNKCVSEDWFAPEVVPCDPGQPKWGSFVVYNGYQYTQTDSIHWLDVDFSLAPGIFSDLSSWVFTTGNGILIDPNTGTPTVGTDWSSVVSNPVRNQWKVQIPVDQLPQPAFDLACRMSVLRLSFFAEEIPGTRTNLWSINHHWNEVGSEYASNNEFVLRYAPFGCLETVTPPQTSSECVYLPLGWTGQLPSSATLDAGIGSSYQWSTGATTRTIAVSPTVTTSYTVSISTGNAVTMIKTFNVTVQNVRCGNTNGNNPQHKVTVCHRPPGNPNNVQNICIDWSGVPAHVKRFRAPGSNPHQGHDSGCEIGTCGGNPCL